MAMKLRSILHELTVGFGSLTLFPDPPTIKSDTEALQDDWQHVGEGIQKAMDAWKEEQPKDAATER
jgi:hypothetical protein